METNSGQPKAKRERMKRCAEWLVSQGMRPDQLTAAMPPEPVTAAESVVTKHSLPSAVDEDSYKPLKVSRRKLRTHGLRLECDWSRCYYVTGDYEAYQKHVRMHIPHLKIVNGPNPQYKCLWDICGHQSSDPREMVRHVNFHAYQSKLMAVGVSAQYNLGLLPCRRDSTRRHTLPPQREDYRCFWDDCESVFTAIQDLFTHIKQHQPCKDVCLWGGCGQPVGYDNRRHILVHTKEQLVACGHCGARYVANFLLRDHLQKQNIGQDGGFKCSMCGIVKATRRLLHIHERQHVCEYACSHCDMTTHSLSALSVHIRYRHLPDLPELRPFKCNQCDHATKSQNDLKKHIACHLKRKMKKVKPKVKPTSAAASSSDESAPEQPVVTNRRYMCHMCPGGEGRLYTRGARLSVHLMKDHGAQWPDGHCRFRYQKHEDGFYRLTTTRFESLEVSRQITLGTTKEPITEDFSVKIKKKCSASKNGPILYAVNINSHSSADSAPEAEEDIEKKEESVKNEHLVRKGSSAGEHAKTKKEIEEETEEEELKELTEEVTIEKHELFDPSIEVTICDLDEKGNVIRSEVVQGKIKVP